MLLKENYTQKEIADKLGVHKSTVSREISKRRTPNGYFAEVAQLHHQRQRKKEQEEKEAFILKEAEVPLQQTGAWLESGTDSRQA